MRGPYLSIALVLLALSSCRGLKYATEERPLFKAYAFEWTTAPERAKGEVGRELEGLVKPAPNNSLFGLRPTVALHNMVKEPRKPNGLRNLLKNKIGSAPVYLADVPVADINAAVVNRLNNRGYFGAWSSFTQERSGRTAKVVFTVDAGTPHHLRNITYADSTDTLNMRIARTRRTSTLKQGDLYDLAALTAERARVTNTLRNAGYYHMKEDDLVFRADTSVGGHQVDLLLRVKAGVDEKATRRYTLDEVYVHGDHDALLPPTDSTMTDSTVLYINYLNNYRPEIITRGVFLRGGRYYSARDEQATQRYLSSYSVFQRVDIRFTEDSARNDLLHTDVYLTPLKRWELFSELNAISKSNNFAGPGMKVGFKDRDLFRGAEIFTVDLNGRFETQVAGAQKGTNAYEIGAKVALQFPRIVPLNILRSAKWSVPTTRLEMGYGLFRRVGLYGLESFSGGFNYLTRPKARVWNDLHIFDVSYSSLYYSSDVFNAFLDRNPAVRRSFEEQFIVGMGYTRTFATDRANSRRGHAVVSLGADEGGFLLASLFAPTGPRPDDGFKLLGQRFAQYVRLKPEVRYYRPLGGNGGQLVGRVLANVGIPYGNSDVLPYVKQFFVGGTNSLRAFRARSVGPGTYKPAEGNTLQIDQVGDVKFEANVEYRFPIAGYIKGALFADAGNIWLVNDDPQRPGGKFDPGTAGDELAVGAGFGIRFDPDVIVVRLDLATPLRDPSLPVGDRWVFDDLKPKVFDNVVFNIAIGYPF